MPCCCWSGCMVVTMPWHGACLAVHRSVLFKSPAGASMFCQLRGTCRQALWKPVIAGHTLAQRALAGQTADAGNAALHRLV